MSSEKQRLLSHLQSLLKDKVKASQEAIGSTKASRDSDSKSSAGDKHEVGRAMAQIELNNQEAQLAKTLQLLQELDRVPLERQYEQVEFGSLIRTDDDTYFISIGLGQVKLEQQRYFVVSLDSPVGQLLSGSKTGEALQFNGKIMTIRSIA